MPIKTAVTLFQDLLYGAWPTLRLALFGLICSDTLGLGAEFMLGVESTQSTCAGMICAR